MKTHRDNQGSSIYTYSYKSEDRALCQLEMRAFFGTDSETHVIESSVQVNPSRSPFMNERIDVLFEADSIEELIAQVERFTPGDKTFKVIFVKNPTGENPSFTERQSVERKVGLVVRGNVDIEKPEQLFAIMHREDHWVFGNLFQSESIWFRHEKKPHNYSTALGTKLARSIVNIAIPNPKGVKAIDPCCGIGTVLIEARSMGIDIQGSDMNPLVINDIRENLAHFELDTTVTETDMRTITGNYDVAIIDMPYNISSVITEEEKKEMFKSARTYAKKVVLVTIDPVDELIKQAGFTIVDRCVAIKNITFSREVLVCE